MKCHLTPHEVGVGSYNNSVIMCVTIVDLVTTRRIYMYIGLGSYTQIRTIMHMFVYWYEICTVAHIWTLHPPYNLQIIIEKKGKIYSIEKNNHMTEP